MLLGAQELFEVLPNGTAIAQVMLGGQQRFKDCAPDRIPADFVEMKRAQLAQLSFHGTGVHRDALQSPMLHSVGTDSSTGRQLDQGSFVELVEETARRHVRQLSVG